MTNTIEIDKKENETPTPSPETSPESEIKNKIEQLEAEEAKKREKLQNMSKAIEEAEAQLEKVRKERKEIVANKSEEQEEDPEIDFTDPGAKAWDKHISSKLSPIQQQTEKEKAEVRKYALSEFLKDKPALAKDPEKLKELMQTYESIKTATERNKEGVLTDLNKAFAAVYHEDLISAAQTAKFEKIKEKQLFSDPAVTEGSTGYVNEREVMPQYSSEDRKILAKWGITPEQHWEMIKEQSKKSST